MPTYQFIFYFEFNVVFGYCDKYIFDTKNKLLSFTLDRKFKKKQIYICNHGSLNKKMRQEISKGPFYITPFLQKRDVLFFL